MKTNETNRLLLALACCALIAPRSFATEGRLLADTHVFVTGGDKLGKNYGEKKLLELGPGRQVFIQFDLSPLPAECTDEQIAKATLELSIDKVLSPGTFEVRNLDGEWFEHDVSGDSAPEIEISDGDPDTQSIVAEDEGRFLSIDVSDLVREWVDGSTNNGFALILGESSPLNVKFDSGEAKDPGIRPRLEIELKTLGAEGEIGPEGDPGETGEEGPTGPQGAQGPAGANGPTGPTGANGPDGANGAVTEVAADAVIASMPSTGGGWQPITASVVTITISAGETIYFIGTAAFNYGSSNTFTDFDVGYRVSGSGGYNVTEDYHSYLIQPNTRFTYPLFRHISGLAAGTYDVAMCYRTGTGSVSGVDIASSVVFAAK